MDSFSNSVWNMFSCGLRASSACIVLGASGSPKLSRCPWFNVGVPNAR